jgi:hypothetical protein
LAGFHEGGCSAAGGDGLNRGRHVLRFVRCRKASIMGVRSYVYVYSKTMLLRGDQ